MRPKHIIFRRSPVFAKSALLGITLAGAGAFVGIPSALAVDATWDGGASTNVLNDLANWTGDALPNGSGDTATWDGSVAGDLALIWSGTFGGGFGSNGTNLSLTSGQTGSLSINGTSGTLNLGTVTIASGAGAFILGSDSGTASVIVRAPARTFTNDSSNTATIRSNVSVGNGGGAGNTTATFTGSGNWLIEGSFFSAAYTSASSAMLAKSGSGTLTLAGANIQGGTTTISGGTIAITHGSALGTGNVTLSGGRLALSNNISVTDPANYNLSGSNNAASSVASDARILNSSGNNTISGNINFANVGGTFVNINSASGTLTLDGNIAATLTTTTGRNFNFTGDGNIVSNGVISDGTVAVAVHKNGAGTLTLNNTSTYTGDTTVSTGTLYISGGLSTSAVSVSSGATIGAGDASGTLGGGLHLASGAMLDVSLGILTVDSSATVSFDNFGFSNLIGFDVETEDLGTYTLIDGEFTLDATNISNFGLANAYTRMDGKLAYFDEGSLTVTIIPEPGAAFLGTIGCFLLLNRRRRC